MQLVATPVDLVHPRVDGRGDPLRTLLAVGPLGQDRQVGDRQYRALQGEGQALDHADGDAHAGEGARTAPESDGVHRGQGDAGLIEQVADHRQQALGVQARDHLVVTERPPLVEQGDGAGFGGGIQGQQSGHRRFRVVKRRRLYQPSPPGNADGPQAGRRCYSAADQLRAESTFAVICSTEPTPAMLWYFGVPSAADSFW